MAPPAESAHQVERRSAGLLTSALVAACALITIERVAEGALRSPYFLTGWALFAVTLGFVLSAHIPPRLSLNAHARRLGYHADATLFGLVLAGAHVQWRLVNGWLDLCLTFIAIGFVWTVLAGWWAARTGASLPQLERWLRRQGFWAHAVVGAGLAHGLFMHSHGALAHWVLGK